ncbi:MAG: hypothetical protein AB7J30_02055 [Hyphomicrobium sp.]
MLTSLALVASFAAVFLPALALLVVGLGTLAGWTGGGRWLPPG